MNKVACLSGDDIVALLSGEKVSAHGIDFVFDGMGIQEIEKSLTDVKISKQHRAKDALPLKKN